MLVVVAAVVVFVVVVRIVVVVGDGGRVLVVAVVGVTEQADQGRWKALLDDIRPMRSVYEQRYPGFYRTGWSPEACSQWTSRSKPEG